jgi:hypothetical protein
LMLGEDVPATALQTDKAIVRDKLFNGAAGTPEGELLVAGDFGTVFDAAAQRFAAAETVGQGMGELKTLRYLTWMTDDLQRPFETVGRTLTDTRDGDLSRSASVFLADATLRQPDQLAQPAADAVTNFFENSDIDGSQIVVSLVLDPIRHGGPEARRVMATTLPTLHTLAANPSVNFALSN